MAAPFHPPAIAPTPAPTAAPPPAPMAVRLPGVAQATARGARKQKVRYFRMTLLVLPPLERLARRVFKPFEGPPKFRCAGTPHTYICGGCEKRGPLPQFQAAPCREGGRPPLPTRLRLPPLSPPLPPTFASCPTPT